MQGRGVTRFVYTNVDRDGMLEGPDLDEVRARVARPCAARFLYSGGIGSLDDLRGAARPAPGEPGRRDLRQGALRGPLHRARGPGGARAATDAAAARHPLPRRGQGPRRQGHRIRGHPRRRRPGRAGRALPGRGRRRARASSTSPRRTRSARPSPQLARRCADDVFIPFTIGGGVRSVEDAQAVLDAGADKVSVNSAAVAAARAARRSWPRCSAPSAWCWPSTPAREPDGAYDVFVNGGRTPIGRDAVEWAREGVERGAGEILLTSMDRDGTEDGYELELTRAVADAVDVPVIASGGAGTLDHLVDAVEQGGADAVLCASIFHYGTLQRARGQGAHARGGRSPSGSERSDCRRDARRDLRERIRRLPAWSGCCPRSRACRPSTSSAAPCATCCAARHGVDLDLAVEGDARSARAGARRAARRRGAASTSASAPPRCAPATLQLRPRHHPQRDLPEPGRAARGAAGAAGRGPAPARLRDQRDGGRPHAATTSATCTTRSGAWPTSRRASCACCTTGSLPRRPDPAAARRALRGAARLRAWTPTRERAGARGDRRATRWRPSRARGCATS